MNVYFRRSAKYFVQLVVLFIVLFAFMYLTGTTAIKEGSIEDILFTRRGLLLAISVVALSLLYPRFGFVRREIVGDIDTDRELILRAFAVSGYEIVTEQSDSSTMVFRADNIAKRITTMWEDRIVVSSGSGVIVVDGIRKEVIKIEFRVKGFLSQKSNESN